MICLAAELNVFLDKLETGKLCILISIRIYAITMALSSLSGPRRRPRPLAAQGPNQAPYYTPKDLATIKKHRLLANSTGSSSRA